jgi:hypothetical protein
VSTAFNLIMLNINWYVVVDQAAAGRPLVGPLWVSGWLFVHLVLVPGQRLREVAAILGSGVVGVVADSALVWSGFLEIPGAGLRLGLTAPFMVALWLSLATAFPFSLAWLVSRRRAAAVVGAVSGPFAYWSGAQLGAVVLPVPMASAAIVGVVWAIALPLLLFVRVACGLDHITECER